MMGTQTVQGPHRQRSRSIIKQPPPQASFAFGGANEAADNLHPSNGYPNNVYMMHQQPMGPPQSSSFAGARQTQPRQQS